MDTNQILIFTTLVVLSFFALLYARRRADFRRSIDMVFLRVLVPKKESDQDEKKETVRDFKEQVSLMEQLLSSLKALYSHSIKARIFGQDYISFEYVAFKQEIYFYIVAPKKAKILIEKQVAAFYPDAIVEETEEVNIFTDKKVVR